MTSRTGGESKGRTMVTAILIVARLVRPGVRCRYGVQNEALKSTTRRLCSIDAASGRRGVVPYMMELT